MEINISFFGLWKRAKTDKGEEKRRRRRRRRREEKKEEGRRKETRDQRYGFVWFSMDSSMELVMNFYRDFVWIFGMNFCMDTCLGVCNISFYVDYLFGLVVVLNGGKFCIEKILGFRGDVVLFF